LGFCFGMIILVILEKLQKEIDNLQDIYGAQGLQSIYGAGCIDRPEVMLVFMNPTARNVSAHNNWKGLRAPWLGTKNIWGFLQKLNILSEEYFQKIRNSSKEDWSPNFCLNVYKEISDKKVFITNLAKCTQVDAKPLKNSVFREYLPIFHKEVLLTNPKHIVTFGNQVSSIILGKPISVSKYKDNQSEIIRIGLKDFNLYPAYYPVGQGRRNMPLSIERIKRII